MPIPTIQFQRLSDNPDLPLPAYASTHAAAFDLRAAVPADAPLTLAPGQRAVIGTGFNVALPEGYELQLRPRSGLAAKHGLSFVNTPGTIDADYRGEIGIILINHGTAAYTVQRGDRIAQCVLAPVVQAAFTEVSELSATDRGTGGFGSTGHN